LAGAVASAGPARRMVSVEYERGGIGRRDEEGRRAVVGLGGGVRGGERGPRAGELYAMATRAAAMRLRWAAQKGWR
jgi:hypothetical protein